MKILIKRITCRVVPIAFFIFVSMLLSFGVSGLSAKTSKHCTTKTIVSSAGPICGKVVTPRSSKNSAKAFLGIRFGESTAGEKRWTYSVKPKKSKKLIKATDFGAICPQDLKGFPDHLADLPQNEDCLFLNVWTPKKPPSPHPLPVMVFIYGGGFYLGASSFPFYDGSYLAANKGVIVVSFNYRLGVLGFLALEFPPKKLGEPPVKLFGNYGFQDQQLALRWVQENIGTFGGDPNKVTIFGESSGAQSVSLHLVSAPGSENLFKAGIMESNVLPKRFFSTLEEQTEFGKKYSKILGCSKLKCLQNLPVQLILDEQSEFRIKHSYALPSTNIFGPAIDGKSSTKRPIHGKLIKQPIEGIAKKPILLGTNKNEAVYFTEDQPVTKKQFEHFVKKVFGNYSKKVLAQYPPRKHEDKYNGRLLSKLRTEFVYQCSTRYFAMQSLKDNRNVYTYLFNYEPSFIFGHIKACLEDDNVCHTAEIPLVFHTPHSSGGTFKPQGKKLSSDVIDYWTNFAKVQNPYGSPPHPKHLLPWPKFNLENKQYLSLNVPLSIETDPFGKACNFWDAYYRKRPTD